MINAAIVGVGWWGQKIVNAVQGKSEHIRFIRGVSKEPASVREFAAKHGFELSTEFAGVLTDPRVQAVVLATPHTLHTQQIVDVAQSGKAVFCEKPLALNKADAVRSTTACRDAGVLLGLGTNKRFWPSMRELRRVVASGELGEILHVEGHYSNENSGAHFSPWRGSPVETPGAGMTGSGIHVLDALVNLLGPVARVQTQVITRKPAPDPTDTLSIMFEFANKTSALLGAVRATPFYWRIHVFGRDGSAEALGETELVIRRKGAKPEHLSYAPLDSLKEEFDVFADAVAGKSEYPIRMPHMVNVVAAFEAVVQSIETARPVSLTQD
jgi:predicted dehydrogenase